MWPRKLLTFATLMIGFSAAVPGAANAIPAQPDPATHVEVAGSNPGYLKPAGGAGVDAGPYTWVNARSGKCLDQNYSSGVPHSDVLAWTCNGASNQYWYVNGLSDGTNVLVNYRSGKCLDQNYSGGVAHSDVLAWTCNGASNQRWIIYAYSDGTFALRNARSGMCLDQNWSGGIPHSDVLAWPCNGASNQYWF